MKITGGCALVVLAMASSAMAAAGPTGVLYITNYGEYGANTGVDAVQGNTVFSWDSGYPVGINIAVYGDVRTMGYSGGDSGDKFTLAGAPLGGGPYTNIISLSQEHDGTSDGNYNYTVNYPTGDILRYDRNWANSTVLFNLTSSFPDVGYITMNAADSSFWLMEWNGTGIVQHRDYAGNLLGSFNTGLGPTSGLAFDPLDGTLWTSNYLNTLYQFSQSGTLMQTYTNGSLSGQFYGMEFDTTPVPEPATLGMLLVGAAGLIVRRRRN